MGEEQRLVIFTVLCTWVLELVVGKGRWYKSSTQEKYDQVCILRNTPNFHCSSVNWLSSYLRPSGFLQQFYQRPDSYSLFWTIDVGMFLLLELCEAFALAIICGAVKLGGLEVWACWGCLQVQSFCPSALASTLPCIQQTEYPKCFISEDQRGYQHHGSHPPSSGELLPPGYP